MLCQAFYGNKQQRILRSIKKSSKAAFSSNAVFIYLRHPLTLFSYQAILKRETWISPGAVATISVLYTLHTISIASVWGVCGAWWVRQFFLQTSVRFGAERGRLNARRLPVKWVYYYLVIFFFRPCSMACRWWRWQSGGRGAPGSGSEAIETEDSGRDTYLTLDRVENRFEEQERLLNSIKLCFM